MNFTRRKVLTSASALALLPSVRALAAADYPVKPIELIVPVAPGGGTDVVARAFAETARKYLPQQPIIVVNKPGASGAVGTAELINSKPDGYRLGLVICELT